MLLRLFIAWCLMAACVAIHAAGVSSAMKWALTLNVRRMRTSTTWLLIRLAGWMIALHLVEIGVWGVFYTLSGAIGDLQTALYFSAVTYTTTGYGDVVLAERWRLVGGIEALTGILMCGWSTAFFFWIFSRVHGDRFDPLQS